MVKGTVQGWLFPRADPEEHPTFGAELHNFMGVSVHQEDFVIRGYVDSVGVQELTITPGSEQAAISVEDQNRRVLALVNVDPVARISGHVGGVAQGYPLGKFPEGMDHLINVVTRTDYVSVHEAFTLEANRGQRMDWPSSPLSALLPLLSSISQNPRHVLTNNPVSAPYHTKLSLN
jgi:hypothetical protein